MYERLLDKNINPSLQELENYCGENKLKFIELNHYLMNACETIFEIRFPYGKQYGWSVTHRVGKKLVCDVFAENRAFTIMVRLTDKQFMSVLQSRFKRMTAY